MSVQRARTRVGELTEEVSTKVIDTVTADARLRAVTINRPRAEVLRFRRDAPPRKVHP
jgi:hypothetical protein